ncbi:MAG: hypothetical protein QOF51_1115 [Chloroflexota bacterium]|jgi:CBS-domain-containing membrane protein|nr:hypothetical protein [Chloroflexota bacterium]
MAASALWQRRLSECSGLVHLAPPVAYPNTSLANVVTSLANDPRPGGVFVTDADDRLLGWIPERTLDADLLVTLLPSELWRSVGEVDVRDLLRAARAHGQTAKDLMRPARTVQPDAALKDVIVMLARSESRVLALVDDQKRLLGYVTMFDVLADLLQHRA